MGEVVIMHDPGVAGQLTADVINPATISQAYIFALGQQRQVFGAWQLTGDHRPAAKGQAVTLQAPGNHFGSGDIPLGELLEVLPLGFDPRAPHIAAQAFASTGVTLDVIVDPVTLNANNFTERVVSQALALEGENRIDAAKIRRQCLVSRRQCPSRHQSASPYRCLRS
ncbi:hypothetical protein D3C81_949620 [compost metagenome]